MTLSFLYADTETFSEVPIKNGTHAYAEKAEVILFPFALDDEPVEVWDVASGSPMPSKLEDSLADPNTMTVWHNSHFDRTVLRHALGINLPIERVHDTMIQALAHGLPGGLGVLCEIFKLPIDKAKDKAGRQLINLFCKPRPKNMKVRRATHATHPVEWSQFKTYAGLDVEAMRTLHRKMPMWNYTGVERILWEIDQLINDRGFKVDVRLALAAIDAVSRAQEQLASDTQDITYGYVNSANQRDEMLAFILGAYGVTLPDMQASTLERRLNDPDLPSELKELLAIRLQASTSSTSKYQKLVDAVSSDGRLRGCLQFCGASRTGRWAGRVFQPQNLPRPTLKQKDIDSGIEALKAGCADLITDNVMQLASSCIRGCIVAPEGRKLVVSDLSNIEGRGCAWLAGEAWKLDAFRAFDAGKGHDLYAVAYAKAFNVTPESVMENKKTGDGLQRQVGKVMELMLQYEGGVGAFLTGAATYGIDLDNLAKVAWPNIPQRIKDEAASLWDWAVEKNMTFGLKRETYIVCDSLKRMWREAHPAIASFWKDIENACIAAVQQPGKKIQCRKVSVIRTGAWLRIILPSGRNLCYASPRVENGKLSYMGINQYSRRWERLKTYGGKLTENITQALSRDVMASNMPAIERAGYNIALSVHDELITEAPDTEDYNPEDLSGLLSQVPTWGGNDLPLAAGGFEAYRYKKE